MRYCLFVMLIVLGTVGKAGAKTTGVSTSQGNTNWNEAVWTNGFPAAGDTVILSGAAKVVLTNSTPLLAKLIVTNTASLILDQWDTTLNAEEVIVHGQITHTNNADTNGTPGVYASWVPNARVYIVCSNLTVLPAGKISANDMGYRGGQLGGSHTNGYGPGGGFGGPSACSGGGYGSEGMNAGTTVFSRTYGSLSAPEDPGSGGGGRSTYAGGAGGGAIRIEASGAVRVDGTISADSTVFYNAGRFAGAGSGGSVYITCRTFHGTGSVSAVAVAYEQGGSAGGGGGRIAIHYDTNAQASVMPQPTVRFSVRPSLHNNTKMSIPGSGTLWLTDSRFFPYSILTGGYAFHIPGFTNWAPDSLTVDDAKIIMPSNCLFPRVTNTLVLRGPEARLDITNDFTVGNLLVTNRARIYFYSSPTNAGGPNYGRLVTVENTMFIGSNSYLYPYSDPTNGGSILFRTKDMTVESNGWIFAYETGFAGGYSNVYPGFGPGGGQMVGQGQSGGHGGRGTQYNTGVGTGGASNDVRETPILPGSGGSGYPSDQGLYGGYGGGVIRIEAVGTVWIDGTLLADGGNRETWGYGYITSYNRCGAGGSIYLRVYRLLGKGFLFARGGSATSYRGTGGGGGRIAVWTKINEWSGSPPTGATVATNVAGGVGSNAASHGETGTVYWTSFPLSGTLIQIR